MGCGKAICEEVGRKGQEKQDDQNFWRGFLSQVLGISDPEDRLKFQYPVDVYYPSGYRTKWADVYIPETGVLIEQKSCGVDLDDKRNRGNGEDPTPLEQARQYANNMPFKPRWIITCNFQEFRIYDTTKEKYEASPQIFHLADLERDYPHFEFLIDNRKTAEAQEVALSRKAGELVGTLYDALKKQYRDPDSEQTLKSLNKLCVRLVFCLYAEKAEVFPNRNMFREYLSGFQPEHMQDALRRLFEILNTPEDQRYSELPLELDAFPYVNGGLFDQQEGDAIPVFNEEIANILLHDMSEGFRWEEINPTIFGVVFESTLDPTTRESNGMHYTSVANIHKLIDPLFLNDLNAEFQQIMALKTPRTRKLRLRQFQDKLASLTFLDPACGSGNFLTESYLSLRRLENKVIAQLRKDKEFPNIRLDEEQGSNAIKVNIFQFYGIEINDFAVDVAKTALWISEIQMLRETALVFGSPARYLPLNRIEQIWKANALTIDWEDVVPREKLNYIIGNPPFMGASEMKPEQKSEAVTIFGKGKRVNSIDYVGAWYYKAAMYMQGTEVRCAFVSTNSITQGEQVAPLWGKLLADYKLHIDFAHRTFRWDSEAKDKAHVHCVIIGVSIAPNPKPKMIYAEDAEPIPARNINPYLQDGPNILIESRGTPLCDVPKMTKGNKPSDGGNLILTQSERDELLSSAPELTPYVRRYIGSTEMLNGKPVRYCLWLKDASPAVFQKNREVMRRLEAVRQARLKSTAKPTQALAEKPYRFFSTPQTDSPFLGVPEVSSGARKYIPIGFFESSIIASNKLLIVPDATLFHFGVLMSSVHMAWVNVIGGRLKSDFQYSGATVYNPYPWPEVTEDQQTKIEQTAQLILDVRGKYPDCTLATLYHRNAMPDDLQAAHRVNDRAVMKAYGFDKGMTESEIVAELMERYRELTKIERKK